MKTVLLILFAVGIGSCKTSKNTKPITVENKGTRPESYEAYPQAEIGAFQKSNDPYTLVKAEVRGNYLDLTVSYGGGCNDHGWRLIGSPELSKDKQPIRRVQLVHDKKGDTCKAIKEEKLTFAISVLSNNYAKGEAIQLQFDNYKEVLIFTFQ